MDIAAGAIGGTEGDLTALDGQCAVVCHNVAASGPCHAVTDQAVCQIQLGSCVGGIEVTAGSTGVTADDNGIGGVQRRANANMEVTAVITLGTCGFGCRTATDIALVQGHNASVDADVAAPALNGAGIGGSTVQNGSAGDVKLVGAVRGLANEVDIAAFRIGLTVLNRTAGDVSVGVIAHINAAAQVGLAAQDQTAGHGEGIQITGCAVCLVQSTTEAGGCCIAVGTAVQDTVIEVKGTCVANNTAAGYGDIRILLIDIFAAVDLQGAGIVNNAACFACHTAAGDHTGIGAVQDDELAALLHSKGTACGSQVKTAKIQDDGFTGCHGQAFKSRIVGRQLPMVALCGTVSIPGGCITVGAFLLLQADGALTLQRHSAGAVVQTAVDGTIGKGDNGTGAVEEVIAQTLADTTINLGSRKVLGVFAVTEIDVAAGA